MSQATYATDGERDRYLEGEDPETEDYDEIEGWADIYAELIEVEQQVISTVRSLIPSTSERTRKEIEEDNLPALLEDLGRYQRRYDYWKRRLEEEGSASDSPASF